MKQIQRDEIIATIVMLSLVFFIGVVIGWSVRTVHTKNKLALATYERQVAEKEYYEARTRIMQAFYLSGKGSE